MDVKGKKVQSIYIAIGHRLEEVKMIGDAFSRPSIPQSMKSKLPPSALEFEGNEDDLIL